MAARGYGVGKRSRFYEFRIYKDDIIFLILCVVLSGFTIIGIKDIEFDFYPAIKMSELTITGMVGYISYGILVSLPIIIEVKESLKWKYLRSKI
jgi:energy-coupling factor transport system permease protein